MVGMMPHGWSRLAGLTTQISLHAWGARGMHGWRHDVSWLAEARRPPDPDFSAEALGMHGWRHDASCVVEARRLLNPDFSAEVLEACMVGGMLPHGMSRLAGLTTEIVCKGARGMHC